MKDESTALLDWYDKNGRLLPWREDPTPYHVWLSEIMLQQTRVEAVKEYYDRFLRALPDIQSLARAPEDLYMKLWQGLGYYSRIRNMHRAAQVIVEKFAGEMPHTAKKLRELPGIGDYTSAAIASISFGEKIPAVDGNLLRVFARFTAYEENIKAERAKRAAREFWTGYMPDDRPGDFNQALMDLGSAVCVPGASPECRECPLSSKCLAHAKKEEARFPVMPQKKERKREEMTVFLLRRGEKTAIRKRPDRGLLAGLYEFPNTKGALPEEEAVEFLLHQGIPVLRIRPIGKAVHVFTHKEWHMTGYEVQTDELVKEDEAFIWAAAQEIRDFYAIPSAFGAFMKYLWK